MRPRRGTAPGTGALLSNADEKLFLKEQRRSLDEKLGALGKAFPDSNQLVLLALIVVFVVSR
jgi:hypothetical protein